MIELAPGLLSMRTGWPQVSCIFAPIMRAMMSLPPPGGKPTTMRIGFEGYACAQAPAAAAHSANSARNLAVLIFPPRVEPLMISPMAEKLRPIRRVVTENDEQGRSRVLFDSAAPNVNPGAVSASAGMTDLWVFQSCPAVISGERDDGNLPFHFEPPEKGGHLRIVQSAGRPRNYDPSKDSSAVPPRAPKQRPG